MNSNRESPLDGMLLVLIVLLVASLLAFVSGIVPYPYGMIILLVLIAARLFSRR